MGRSERAPRDGPGAVRRPPPETSVTAVKSLFSNLNPYLVRRRTPGERPIVAGVCGAAEGVRPPPRIAGKRHSARSVPRKVEVVPDGIAIATEFPMSGSGPDAAPAASRCGSRRATSARRRRSLARGWSLRRCCRVSEGFRPRARFSSSVALSIVRRESSVRSVKSIDVRPGRRTRRPPMGRLTGRCPGTFGIRPVETSRDATDRSSVVSSMAKCAR